jgi:nucleoside-diphosphate-sugar epimerase
MKVLVTGGSGFLGINLIRFLRTKDVEEIRVLDIADFDYPERSEPWLKFTKGDVRDIAAVERTVVGCDVVVHCAAALPLYDEADIRTTEVDGCRNVLDACRKFGCDRLVQISSTAVYGVPERHPIFESDPLVGVGPYGQAKIDAENICREAIRDGYCVSIIRPKSFVGPERLAWSRFSSTGRTPAPASR